LDAPILEKVAKSLKVPVEAIKNFDEQSAVFNIQNNYEGSSAINNSGAFSSNYQCTFNPFDKVIELYEALLKREKEKIALLEKLMDKK